MPKKDETKKQEETTDVVEAKETAVVVPGDEEMLGFENEQDGDMLIPMVKVVQLLTPERKEGIAEEGDVINSLTKAKLNGRIFVPVLKFNPNIDWIPRNEGGGKRCESRNGKIGIPTDGSEQLICKQCGKNEWDNTKTGREAQPTCTKYINFLGYFTDDMMPIILTFGRTNYSEGKKLFSLAKVTMQNMFNNGYRIESKLMTKNNNEWYNIEVFADGPVEEHLKEYGKQLYYQLRDLDFRSDEEDMSGAAHSSSVDEEAIEAAEV